MENRDEIHVGLLMGGPSEEREVSLKSGAAMSAALQRKGYRVTEIDPGTDLPWLLMQHRIDVAVLALHGTYGEDGSVQGLLEALGIPYTGSGVLASAICMDKGVSKRLFRDGGIPTPPWLEVNLAEEADFSAVGWHALAQQENAPAYPLFVKPLCSGSSIGVSRVTRPEELEEALNLAGTISPRVILEQEVAGVEITLGVVDGTPMPLVEIEPLEGFFDYQRKYTPGATRYPIPPHSLSPEVCATATAIGLNAYRIAGCQGVARVDLIVDRNNQPWVLEINTLPGMTETSLVPKAAKALGLDFDDLVERICQSASLGACGGRS